MDLYFHGSPPGPQHVVSKDWQRDLELEAGARGNQEGPQGGNSEGHTCILQCEPWLNSGEQGQGQGGPTNGQFRENSL